MKKLFLSMALLLCAGVAFSQPPKEGVLIADETYLVKSGKTGFRVVTVNDSITKCIVVQFANNGKAEKITFRRVADWHGAYQECSFYFKNEQYDEVTQFINFLNKRKKHEP